MNQKQVWNNIAEEWYEFKNEPSEFIIDFLKKQKGNVLDLGGGAGRFLINIKGGKMYLTDFSKEMIQLAKRRAKENNITRVQSAIRKDFTEGQRFAEWLGLEKEGLMRKWGFDGSDQYMYARLF